MARSRECRICGREFTQTDDELSLTELGKSDLIHTKCLLNNNRKLDIHCWNWRDKNKKRGGGNNDD
jgi:hypothetical protein